MASKKPLWMNVDQLKDASSEDVKARSNISVNLPPNFKTISSYQCDTCKLKFTSGQIEPQLKKAARAGIGYVLCPKCSGFLHETAKTIVRDAPKIADRSERFIDKNAAPCRGVNTWVDKAIYGKLVQALAEYVSTVGIDAPQLRFQRGIRTSKFPGEPHSAKGAEFTVEFTDFNNTRNRVVIQAGLDEKGKFIYPRTFKTLSGNEYPLTSRAIEDFTSGKVYTPVAADYTIPPLNYKSPDPVRFREISAGTKKIVKTAQEMVDSVGMASGGNPVAPAETAAGQAPFSNDDQVVQHLRQMGITPERDPVKFEEFRSYLTQNMPGSVTPSDNTGAVPNAPTNNFMSGVGLGKKKALQDMMMEKPFTTDLKQTAIQSAVDQGLSFEEAYDQVMQSTGVPLTLEEFDVAGQTIADTEMPLMAADVASKLIAQAEIQYAAKLHITAEDVQQEYNLDNMTFPEAQTWMDAYLNTFNDTLDTGAGVVESRNDALIAASNKVAEHRVKKALRDKNTLMPFTDPDPEYSLAQQTRDSEARFDMPYEETDGGILPVEQRNVNKMFREKTEPLDTGEQKSASLNKEAMAGILGELYHRLSKDPFGDPEVAQRAEAIMRADIPTNAKFEALQALDQETQGAQGSPEMESGPINPFAQTTRNIEKIAEATGVDLDADEVGQNPMNYSRLKGVVQDYLRAGNIPPTKVDMHKLKDGGYTLDELQKLVDTFKTRDDSAMYPTSHADVNPDKLRSLAEERLADLFKEMPMEPVDAEEDADDIVGDSIEDDSEETSPEPEILEGGVGDGAPDDAFDPSELAKGIEVEMEHIKDNEALAKEIAEDHLTEIPDYYTRLDEMEKAAKQSQTARDMPSLLARLNAIAAKKVQTEDK